MKSLHAIASTIATVGAALVAVLAHAQPQLPGAPPQVLFRDRFETPKGGEAVTFRSLKAGAMDLKIPAMLFKPAGAPLGAVVIVNSPSGWSDAREGHYGRSLSSAGYAALAIDTYGPRGIQSTQADNTQLSTSAQMRDAFAARRYLISIGYPADKLAIMGTGRGGTIALLAADRTFLQDEEERFALAMAISAGCLFHPREPRAGTKIFMALAENDDITGVKPCERLANEYAAAGGQVVVKIYRGASNGFDGHPLLNRVIRDPVMETFVNCYVPVEPDGRSTYNGKTFAENDSGALIMEMRKSCIQHGGSGWTNPTRKANVTLDLIEFLDANFRK
ncbi:dienelactone hydrolase family protein [Variovorax sp. YR216]|uniref:dienelactone hydrolase family protein n=1 Tax=Variovorax sp. YR216 TaxID=1882828 RepID=UPI00089DA16D|nr:dienelactone hydrolase family protein [Variovorax sp. YR216]SEB25583.1 Dienelactone hydrolase [Variovorax sp. YR216]